MSNNTEMSEAEEPEDTLYLSEICSSIHTCVYEDMKRSEDLPYSDTEFKGIVTELDSIFQTLLGYTKVWPLTIKMTELSGDDKLKFAEVLLFVTGNVKSTMWNNASILKIANEIIAKPIIKDNFINCDIDREETLMYHLLKRILLKLNKDIWNKNPFAIESFHWCIEQLKSPTLSEYLDLVFSPPLLFMDHYHLEYKLKGLEFIRLIIANTSPSELRMYQRAHVYYDAVFKLLYLRDLEIIAAVHSCMIYLVRVVEKPDFGKWTKYDDVFQLYINNMSIETVKERKIAFSNHLPDFIDLLGLEILTHTKNLFQLFEEYLELDHDVLYVNIFTSINRFITVAWIRSSLFTEPLAKILLKFIIVKPSNSKACELCRECIILLAKANPRFDAQMLLSPIEI